MLGNKVEEQIKQKVQGISWTKIWEETTKEVKRKILECAAGVRTKGRKKQ